MTDSVEAFDSDTVKLANTNPLSPSATWASEMVMIGSWFGSVSTGGAIGASSTGGVTGSAGGATGGAVGVSSTGGVTGSAGGATGPGVTGCEGADPAVGSLIPGSASSCAELRG